MMAPITSDGATAAKTPPPWPVVWFALVAFVPLAWRFLRPPLPGSAVWFDVVLHVLALSAWGYRLWRSGMRAPWASVTILGLAGAFATGPLGRPDTSALGEAVFLYLLLSLFAVYSRRPDLQALAAAALLLSAGVLTKPPVAISCLLLSLSFFLLHHRESRSGSVGFALLIFTPSALCLASAALLTALTRGALGAGALATGGFFGVAHHGATAGHPGLRWLAFPLVVAAYRLWTRKASACDLAFVLMLAGVAILSVVPNMPAPLHHMEIVYLAMGGATALLGQSPPKGMAGGMLVSVSLLGAWVV